jgi:hypothetical protein
MKIPYIPKELLHIILEYDGRIKYRKGEYVDIIHKNDERYNIIRPHIVNKIEIINHTKLDGSGFYLILGFETIKDVGLVYDYNFSYKNEFEICYYDFRNYGIKQIRTYL